MGMSFGHFVEHFVRPLCREWQ